MSDKGKNAEIKTEIPGQLVRGICTVLSGMCIQAVIINFQLIFSQMLGIVPTWGNIVVYVTSYFRIYDDSITLSTTFIVFPLTLAMGALSMQLGTLMIDYVHPKLHLFIGGLIFVISVMISAYMINFYLFLLFYAVFAGIGYGIMYMLPLKQAWLFFPNRKGMIGGIILASHSFAAIGWSFLCANLINPNNEMPNLFLNVGTALEVLFAPDTDVAHNVKYMLNIVSYIELGLFLVAVILMNKKLTLSFD